MLSDMVHLQMFHAVVNSKSEKLTENRMNLATDVRVVSL